MSSELKMGSSPIHCICMPSQLSTISWRFVSVFDRPHKKVITCENTKHINNGKYHVRCSCHNTYYGKHITHTS